MKATVPSERMGSALRIAIYDGAALLITAAGVILAADADVDSAFYLLAAAAIAYTLLAIASSWSLTFVGAGRADL
jgi:hypothetical protein